MKKAIIIVILSMCLDIYSQTNYNRVYYFNIIELINNEKKIDSVLITQKVRKTNEENTDFANYNTVFRQNTWKFYLNKWGKLDTFRENELYLIAKYDSFGIQNYGSAYGIGRDYEFLLDVKFDSLLNTVLLTSNKDSFKLFIRNYIDSTIIITENYPSYRKPPFIYRIFNASRIPFDFFEWYEGGYCTKTVINHQNNTVIKYIYQEGNFLWKIDIQNYFDKNGRLYKVVYLTDSDDYFHKSNTKKIWYNKKGEVNKIEVLFHGYSKHTIKRKNISEYFETVKILDKRKKVRNKIFKNLSLQYKIYSK